MLEPTPHRHPPTQPKNQPTFSYIFATSTHTHIRTCPAIECVRARPILSTICWAAWGLCRVCDFVHRTHGEKMYTTLDEFSCPLWKYVSIWQNGGVHVQLLRFYHNYTGPCHFDRQHQPDDWTKTARFLRPQPSDTAPAVHIIMGLQKFWLIRNVCAAPTASCAGVVLALHNTMVIARRLFALWRRKCTDNRKKLERRTPEDGRKLLYAYIGCVCVRRGQCETWIHALYIRGVRAVGERARVVRMSSKRARWQRQCKRKLFGKVAWHVVRELSSRCALLRVVRSAPNVH